MRINCINCQNPPPISSKPLAHRSSSADREAPSGSRGPWGIYGLSARPFHLTPSLCIERINCKNPGPRYSPSHSTPLPVLPPPSSISSKPFPPASRSSVEHCCGTSHSQTLPRGTRKVFIIQAAPFSQPRPGALRQYRQKALSPTAVRIQSLCYLRFAICDLIFPVLLPRAVSDR